MKVVRTPRSTPNATPEELPLEEALGEWLKIQGVGSALELDVRIIDPRAAEFDYEIVVPHGELGIFGEADVGGARTSSHASKFLVEFNRDPQQTDALNSLRLVDEFSAQVSELLGDANQYLDGYTSRRWSDVESNWLDPGIDTTRSAESFIAREQALLREQLLGTSSDSQIMNHALALELGRLPSARDLEIAATLTGREAAVEPTPEFREAFDSRLATYQELQSNSFDPEFLRACRNRLSGSTTWSGMETGLGDSLAPYVFLQEHQWTAAQRDLVRSIPELGLVELDRMYPDLIRASVESDFDFNLYFRVSGEDPVELASLTAEKVRELAGGKTVVIDEFDLALVREALSEEAVASVEKELLETGEFLRWERQLAFNAPTRDVAANTVVRRHATAQSEALFRVVTIRLKAPEGGTGYGDAILMEFPDNRVMLVDTGFDQAAYRVIEQHLRRLQASRMEQGQPLRVDLLITHEHRDHLNGLWQMLQQIQQPNASIEIGQIILGRIGIDSQIAQNVTSVLTDRQLFEFEPVTENLWLFTRNGADPSSRLTLSRDEFLFRADNEPYEGVIHRRIQGLDDVSAEILQLQHPRQPNDSSVAIRVTHRGVTQLYTSDIELPTIRALLDSGVDLQADVLKWPHHISFPRRWSEADRTDLAEFLRRVSPHTIVLSNRGAGQPLEWQQEIANFARQVLDRPELERRIQILSTNDVDGEIMIEGVEGGSSHEFETNNRRLRRIGGDETLLATLAI